MQRRKDIWGEDADNFKPERWENRKVGWEYLPVSAFMLLPFNCGLLIWRISSMEVLGYA
jgi:hypothetical protein